ncbi:hypothetical protein [Mycobacterium gastri]|nr:hypothetical protein MGAST_02580 [Mycobacterium gastri 'Wayne']
MQALSTGTGSYAVAAAANASPLQTLLSRPLVGNGANSHHAGRQRRRR